MHKLLENTHREEFIRYLKARDYYFNKARNLYNIKKVILVLPTSLLIAFYAVLLFLYIYQQVNPAFDYNWFRNWTDTYLEFLLGIVTISAFFACNGITNSIEKNKEISNMISEEYDNKLFNFKRNPFVYDYSNLQSYLKSAKYMPDDYNNWKYEYWYDEIFCADNDRNILCMQMDNIIYSCHIYGASLSKYKKQLRSMLILTGVLMVLSFFLVGIAMAILVFFAFFELLQVKFEEISVCKDMIQVNKSLKELILDANKTEDILANLNYYIHCIEDRIISNRKNGLFVSKRIRNSYLDSKSTYYKELDAVKARFMDQSTVTLPECTEDITIFSLDETKVYSLTDVHNRLRKMLFCVLDVFEANGIRYNLDGGTLLAAVRKNCSGVKADPNDYFDFENGRFLFWDDDVDLSVPADQLEQAKKLIAQQLGDKYVIQDYNNEPFYSPRLSNFRIRECNAASQVAEKDSPLWELYQNKGLFIDIYAYAPILCCKWVDSLYRQFFVHPLHRQLWKTERAWKYTDSTNKHENRFHCQKRVYLRRVGWYEKHAKNSRYYAYLPNFIASYKKAGPYIPRNALWGNPRYAKLEGRVCSIPNNPALILEAFYGKEWYHSVFSTQADLRDMFGNSWYSNAKHKASVMKHIKQIDLY